MRSVNKPHQPGRCFVEKHVVLFKLHYQVFGAQQTEFRSPHGVRRRFAPSRKPQQAEGKLSAQSTLANMFCFFFFPVIR